jgi:hypothetical protein
MIMNEQKKARWLTGIMSPYCPLCFICDISENDKKTSCSLDAFAKEAEIDARDGFETALKASEFFAELLKDKKEKIVTYGLVRWYDRNKRNLTAQRELLELSKKRQY